MPPIDYVAIILAVIQAIQQCKQNPTPTPPPTPATLRNLGPVESFVLVRVVRENCGASREQWRKHRSEIMANVFLRSQTG
jgi:hypothetical protein